MTLFVNIGELSGIAPAGLLRRQGAEMADAGILHDAWLSVEDGRITGYGPMSEVPADPSLPAGPSLPSDPSLPARTGNPHEVVDARGGMVLPAFCDSHTHLVYAGCRDGEFLDKFIIS